MNRGSETKDQKKFVIQCILIIDERNFIHFKERRFAIWLDVLTWTMSPTDSLVIVMTSTFVRFVTSTCLSGILRSNLLVRLTTAMNIRSVVSTSSIRTKA